MFYTKDIVLLMNKKKIIFDMFLNILAVSIPTFVLQLVILPSVSNYLPDERYGLLVTILSFLNVVPSTIGNVLNNIRLLFNNDYIENNEIGDFNLLALILAVIDVLLTIVFVLFYERSVSPFRLILVVLVSVLWLYREYYVVTFRLKIDYIKILICNFLRILGYFIGFLIFRQTLQWEWIYILGLLFSLLYCLIMGTLWKEPIKRTSLFKKTSTQGLMLVIAKVLNRSISYADKMLIYPILGGAVVSVYYAATIFGKVVSLMITPINSVALTYLAKVSTKKNSTFKSALMIGSCVCVLGYVACLLVSRPVLSILYPQYVDQAMKYIAITTCTTVLYALSSIVDPFIMKFFDMKWQIVINGSTVLVYLVICLTLLKFWGLMGFCIGALITNALKLLFMIFIYFRCNELRLNKTNK